MIYLSRLILDTRSSQVRRDIGDCHQLHRRLMRAFPDIEATPAARAHLGILYRTEAMPQEPRLLRVLVQSSVAPDWSRLPASYLGPAPDDRGNPAIRNVDEEYQRLVNGLQIRFRLRANPTRRISRANTEQAEKWRGKRVEIRDEAEQLAWLARKGEQGGFRLLNVASVPDMPDVRSSMQEKVRGKRPEHPDAPARQLRFGAVLFEGHLEVTDADRFRNTLQSGIGSGKAFGFGLLSIATRRS